MRIDFFHIDLLHKPSIKSVSDVYSNCGVDTEFNSNEHSKQIKRYKSKDKNDCDDYNDITEELKKAFYSPNNNSFISDYDLLNLKQAIDSDNYNINTKALLISLIKYTERI